MGVLTLFLAALAAPAGFFVSPHWKNPAGSLPAAGLSALLAGTLSLVLGTVIAGGGRLAAFSGFSTALVFLFLLTLLLKGALLHLLASLWGSRGKAGMLLQALPFSWLPFLLLLPAALIFRAAGMLSLYPLVFLGVLGYSYCMEVGAVKAVYGLSTGRAVLVFLVPILFQLVFLFVFLLGLVSALVGMLLEGTGLL
jgi:hypothetical protein